MIRDAGFPCRPRSSILDVGGGASTLVDDLLSSGFEKVTVLDLSGAALAATKARLGLQSARVQWLEVDVLEAALPEHAYDVWHDRAVFHFLTDAEQRHAYVRAVLASLKPGGIMIVATFAEDGPTMCSGLPVMRYSVDDLCAQFGASFQLLDHEKESHRTPGGNEQMFVYCSLRKRVS